MARRANDEGSIWKRNDGRWSGSYFVPTPAGGRGRRYVYGATREEVHGKLVDLMGQVRKGLPVASTRQTAADYLETWLAEVAARRVRSNTLAGYRTNTCVSLLLSLGVHPRVVMEIAGHSALEMTMNVYGHVALDDQREALDKLNGLLDEGE